MNTILDVLSTQSVYSVLSLVLLLLIIRNFIHSFWSRRHVVKCASELPSMKLKFYHVLGHIHMVLYRRIFGTSTGISTHVYDFLSRNGYMRGLYKDGIALVWQMNNPVIFVYRASTVETILRHTTSLKKAWFYEFFHPWMGTGLFISSGEQWRMRRKLLTPSFHFNILKDFMLVFNKQSNILGDILKQHTKDEFISIIPFLSRCSLDIICETVMGTELNVQTQPNLPFTKAVHALTSATLDRAQKPWFWNEFIYKMSSGGKNYFKNVEIIHDLVKKLISEKKKLFLKNENQKNSDNKTADPENIQRKRMALLDLLLHEHMENNSLSEEDIKDEVNTFTFAGHDSTSMAMSWCLYMIGLHPWVQDKIHRELDEIFFNSNRDATIEDLKSMNYLECVMKESMRLYPIVPAFARTAEEDIQFGKYTVPKSSTIFVITYVLHRDPDVFPNPEKFDPDRFTPEMSNDRHPFAYVPFSAGPRNCIGQRFALMELKTVLSSILRKYKIRSLDPRDRVHLVDEIVLRPEKDLRIQVRQRDQNLDFQTVYYFP